MSVKDLPERGISLIAPGNPSFESLAATLPEAAARSARESYAVFLKNTGPLAVVGYRIKWECLKCNGEPFRQDRSDITSWIFLHGEAEERKQIVGRAEEIIKPNETWLIAFDGPARPLKDLAAVQPQEFGEGAKLEGFKSITVIADGIFFDDGTFIGPDTTNFFTEVKSQMDARHDLLREIQTDLKSGKKVDEVFAGLEAVRNQERVNLGDDPSPGEFYAYFKRLFVQNVLGKKIIGGRKKP